MRVEEEPSAKRLTPEFTIVGLFPRHASLPSQAPHAIPSCRTKGAVVAIVNSPENATPWFRYGRITRRLEFARAG